MYLPIKVASVQQDCFLSSSIQLNSIQACLSHSGFSKTVTLTITEILQVSNSNSKLSVSHNFYPISQTLNTVSDAQLNS